MYYTVIRHGLFNNDNKYNHSLQRVSAVDENGNIYIYAHNNATGTDDYIRFWFNTSKKPTVDIVKNEIKKSISRNGWTMSDWDLNKAAKQAANAYSSSSRTHDGSKFENKRWF